MKTIWIQRMMIKLVVVNNDCCVAGDDKKDYHPLYFCYILFRPPKPNPDYG